MSFIKHSSNQIYNLYNEQNKKTQFETLYDLDKKIGEGMHSSVYICYKKLDPQKITPYAVKVTSFDDEE